MLMAYGGLNLPYDVPANQYLNFGGAKASTSRGTGALPARLPGPVRPRPSALLPRRRHARDLGQRVQRGRPHPSQQRRAGGDVGQPRSPRPHLHLPPLRGARPAAGRARRGRAGSCWRARRRRWRRSASRSASAASGPGWRRRMGLAQEVNRYLDDKAPWKTIGEDRDGRRDGAVHGPGGDQHPQGRALPLPALHLPAAARLSRVRRRRRGRRLAGRASTAGPAAAESPPRCSRSWIPRRSRRRRRGRPDGGAVRLSHATSSCAAFAKDRQAALERAREAGVAEMVVVGIDGTGSREAVALAAATGRRLRRGRLPSPRRQARRRRRRCDCCENSPPRRAWSPWERSASTSTATSRPATAQARAFREQLELAAELGLPVVIHSREAAAETYAVLRDWLASAGALAGGARRCPALFQRRPGGWRSDTSRWGS